MKKSILIGSSILILGILGGAGFLRLQHVQKSKVAHKHILTGDEQYRAGKYQEALTAYQQANAVHASAAAQERIRLAQAAIATQAQAASATPDAPTAKATAAAPKATTGPEPYVQAATKINGWLQEKRFREVEDFLDPHVKSLTLTPSGNLYAGAVIEIILQEVDAFEDPSAFEQSLNLWITQSPASSLAYTLRASYYDKLGWRARGNEYASKVSAERRQKMRHYLTLAMQDAAKAVQLDAQNPLPFGVLYSSGLAMSVDDKLMESFFQRAITIAPQYLEIHQTKLEHLLPKWGGSVEELRAFVKETLQRAPRGSALPIILADAHESIGWDIAKDIRKYYNTPEVWADIERSFARVREDFPASGYWAARYAMFMGNAGKLAEAEKYFELGVQLEPENFQVYYLCGYFFEYYRKDLYQALQEYTEAVRLRPYNLNALSCQARVLSARETWSQALKAYATLIKFAPQDSSNYYYRANVYYRRGQYQQALSDYTQAIKLKPDYRDAYQWRAACYQQLGMAKEQQQDLQMVEKLTE
jgi:tetratricopeptide (TPR) repeat protein